MAEEELFSQETNRDESIQNAYDDSSFLEFLFEEFCSEENNSADTFETSEENRKRKISSEEEIINVNDSNKQTKAEVCGMRQQVIFDFSDNGCIYPDSQTNKIARSCHIAPDSRNFACINSEESNFKNEELKAFDYLDKEKTLSTGQSTAYKKNIFQKGNAACKTTNSNVDKVAKVGSAGEILPVPGTSCCLENNTHSKSCVEKVQNGSSLKQLQQPPVETELKQPRCLACQKTISEHVLDVMDRYKCCRCLFIYDNFNDLQIHVYNEHTRPHYCDVCQMNYSDANSHDLVGTCDVCNQNFLCEYQLEEHYLLVHKDILKTHCRICQRNLDEHSIFSEVVKKYQCCFSECKNQYQDKSKLNDHLYKHFLLKIFKCEVCGNHFKHPTGTRRHLKDIHPLCKFCEKRFLNVYFLNEHLREEHREQFS